VPQRTHVRAEITPATAPKALTATPARTSPRDLVRGPILPAPSRHTLFDSNSAAAGGALAFGLFAALLAAVAVYRPRRGRIARAAALLTPSAAPRLLLERPG
jgi:predicted outer membrane repeat protein